MNLFNTIKKIFSLSNRETPSATPEFRVDVTDSQTDVQEKILTLNEDVQNFLKEAVKDQVKYDNVKPLIFDAISSERET